MLTKLNMIISVR